jgi:hypothetical protein
MIVIYDCLDLLALPEHSTDVGDLIQPVPGVLYEDSKLKKGDPRRYKVNCRSFFWSILYIFISLAWQNIQVFMMKVVH